jgi:hypothetical protein
MEIKWASPRDSALLFSPLRDIFDIPPSNTFQHTLVSHHCQISALVYLLQVPSMLQDGRLGLIEL